MLVLRAAAAAADRQALPLACAAMVTQLRQMHRSVVGQGAAAAEGQQQLLPQQQPPLDDG
jgi:hypothetical protein